jgi:hypothetical protein
VYSTARSNAMAEAVNSLYKSELIYNEHYGPWRGIEDVELATLAWVHWWNYERILGPIGNLPPVEFEANWQVRLEKEALSCPESLWIDGASTDTPANISDEHRLLGVST